MLGSFVNISFVLWVSRYIHTRGFISVYLVLSLVQIGLTLVFCIPITRFDAVFMSFSRFSNFVKPTFTSLSCNVQCACWSGLMFLSENVEFSSPWQPVRAWRYIKLHLVGAFFVICVIRFCSFVTFLTQGNLMNLSSKKPLRVIKIPNNKTSLAWILIYRWKFSRYLLGSVE